MHRGKLAELVVELLSHMLGRPVLEVGGVGWIEGIEVGCFKLLARCIFP